MKKCKYLIIGAGISGLSFAYNKSNEDYIILEKDKICGGLCQTFHEKGYVWDVAGHFFHFHSDKTRNFYDNMTNKSEKRIAEKCAKVLYNDIYMNAPFQYNIEQLPTEEFVECLTDLYFAKEDNNDVSFEEFVRNMYGNGIADKFLIPYNEKLYACNMNDLDQHSMGAFLPKLNFEMLMKSLKGKKGTTYNDVFSYPVNGCMEIINALKSNLESERIHLNEQVDIIDIQNKLVHTDKETYSYEYLINSAPLNKFIEMARKSANNIENKTLTYNKVLVLNLGFDKESIDKKVSWIYFPGDEYFYRVGFYNNIAGTEKLSIYVEIGYGVNEDIDVDLALSRTLEDLKKANIISEHKLIAHNSYIIDPGYVHITKEGKEYTDNIIKNMKNEGVYMVGRYARWEYSAMDDSIEQANELAGQI